MNTPALEITGLHKAFGHHEVLDGIDLVVPDRSVTAVLGPSGGGKTTLLRIIAGFEAPDAGTVAIRGTVVAQRTDGGSVLVPPERRKVGIVPQEGALFPHLDVGRNVGFGLPRGAASRTRVAEVLEMVGLPGTERVRPDELSGGQQHRVALARALAPGPSIVVLDEPFSSLDAALRAQVREEVLLVLRAAGTTAVVVTHDQQEALSIADRVAVLLDGRIAQCGDPADLYDHPQSLAVATFVGDADVLTGEAAGGRARCALGEVALIGAAADVRGPVRLVLRPEQVELVPIAAQRAGDPVIDAVLPAECTAGSVRSRAFYGHDGMVRVELPDGTIVTSRVHAARLPNPGDAVAVRVISPVSAFPA